MISGPAISLAIVWMSAGADGGITATLKAVEGEDPAAPAYRKAELTLANAAPRPVEAVLLRPAGGGPAVRCRFAVPPGQTSRTVVTLPPISLDYTVAALDASGEVLARSPATIDRAGEWVATDAFVDATYSQWLHETNPWPRRARLNAILLLACTAAAAAGAVFIPNRFARAAAVGVVALAGVLAAQHFLKQPEDALRVREYYLVRHAPAGPAEVESFTVLAGRRTDRITRRAAAVPYPVYADGPQLSASDAEVDPAARTITLTLRPGAAQILRPGSRKASLPAEPFHGTVSRVADEATSEDYRLIVQANFPHQRALVVRRQSFWPVRPGLGRLRASLASGEAQPRLSVTLSPARWKLSPEEARLFAHWWERYRPTEKTYLVNFAGLPEAGATGGDEDAGEGSFASYRMDVLELSPVESAGLPR